MLQKDRKSATFSEPTCFCRAPPLLMSIILKSIVFRVSLYLIFFFIDVAFAQSRITYEVTGFLDLLQNDNPDSGIFDSGILGLDNRKSRSQTKYSLVVRQIGSKFLLSVSFGSHKAINLNAGYVFSLYYNINESTTCIGKICEQTPNLPYGPENNHWYGDLYLSDDSTSKINVKLNAIKIDQNAFTLHVYDSAEIRYPLRPHYISYRYLVFSIDLQRFGDKCSAKMNVRLRNSYFNKNKYDKEIVSVIVTGQSVDSDCIIR